MMQFLTMQIAPNNLRRFAQTLEQHTKDNFTLKREVLHLKEQRPQNMKVVAEFFTFPISCVYLWSIQYPYFLHSNDLDLLLQDSDSIYLLLQRKCTPERRNTKIICGLLKSQAISWWIDFNSFFPLYSDQRVCNLHSHARHICDTNGTSRNVTGCSNPDAHAQFP